MASSTSAARPHASQVSSTERHDMPTVDFLSSRSRGVGEAVEEAISEFGRERPQETEAPTSARLPQDGHAMTRFLPAFPAPSRDSMPFSEPLPSLSAMLLQNRMIGDYVFRKDLVKSQAAATVTTAFPPQDPFDSLSTLSECDWEELLSGAERLDNYISPDISHVFDSQNKLQGSQDLDMSGREFVSSPAISAMGPVPRTFGDMLVPICLLDPVHARLGQKRSSRYSLRDKPRAAAILPSLKSIRGKSQLVLASPHPFALTTKSPGKSARARLFEESPDTGEKENQPVNVELCATRAVHALTQLTKPKGNAGKKPISHGRCVLDGANRAGKKPIGSGKKPISHSRRSLDSATPVNVPRPAPAASQSARKWKGCSVPGCAKGSRSKGLCKRHGGGRRCSFPDCPRSDQGGGLCIGHGGGKRCTVLECSNSAQSRGLCKSHGGGKRCTFEGCTKSCQGGDFCRAHGGGTKRCKAPVCSNYCHTNGLCRIHSRDPEVYHH